ncbi:GatB/YqeY domain-containing protein, partial [Bacteroidota bacterium]
SMLAKESKKLEALRAIKAAILLEKTKGPGSSEISEENEIKILQKLIKQRKESGELYQSKNRLDLAEVELFQASVIEQYLPEQLSKNEIEQIITTIIQSSGATGIQDIGKVMGIASKQLSGKADNKTIANIVKEQLNRQSPVFRTFSGHPIEPLL